MMTDVGGVTKICTLNYAMVFVFVIGDLMMTKMMMMTKMKDGALIGSFVNDG